MNIPCYPSRIDHPSMLDLSIYYFHKISAVKYKVSVLVYSLDNEKNGGYKSGVHFEWLPVQESVE